jgi:hypothetical protein
MVTPWAAGAPAAPTPYPMKSLLFRRFGSLALCCLVASMLSAAAPAAATSPFLGRWALTLPNGGAGWLEVTKENGWYDGSLLWGGGSVVPLASVTLAGDALTVTRLREVVRKNAAGKVVRTQQVTETITAKLAADGTLALTRNSPRNNGTGFDVDAFVGRRVPPLPPRPDLTKVKFGAPVALFNGRDLAGWRLIEKNAANAWVVENGTLANRPPPHQPGQPSARTGNLRTEQEFTDFNLTLEVNVPVGSNSGVYLRGMYEIQVADTFGKPLDPHHMGALYSRITPAVAAERPAGEWQTLAITLVDRHVTVVLNGTTIIDNQPVLGVTGGALWSDDTRAGPIYLQGDHGAVSYRNLQLRPVVR